MTSTVFAATSIDGMTKNKRLTGRFAKEARRALWLSPLKNKKVHEHDFGNRSEKKSQISAQFSCTGITDISSEKFHTIPFTLVQFPL